jgi:hypothetical protein
VPLEWATSHGERRSAELELTWLQLTLDLLCLPGCMGRPIEELPSWFAEMTPAQQAVLGPREGRPGSGVATDGSDVWVEPDPASLSFAWAAGAATAALQQNKNPLMVAHEVWQWETQGYLIIRGVMDPEWIKGCNHALDTFRDDPNVVHKIGASELWQETDCSTLLLPTERDADGEPILEERMTGTCYIDNSNGVSSYAGRVELARACVLECRPRGIAKTTLRLVSKNGRSSSCCSKIELDDGPWVV